ncbi:MAG TPA: heparan-alpha-glucosaminide N-acetyltransferase domain-containing protein [Rhizomicrobium sp.]|jgi:predicted acyltransferase|nr:heparan-alpha-glucosaminide N-acetyltransferase domain-containing protein [Rhizomicrobium sp.]
MEVVETSAAFETVPVRFSVPLLAAAESTTPRERLASLDVMRGFVVIGMIVVNTIAFSNLSYGYHPASQLLSHAAWAGFTFADFVFPAFIFMAGFSVAASLRSARVEWQTVRRIGTRTFALLTLGFLLTNVALFVQPGEWRMLGVLQRIGLCYFATALLFLCCSSRARFILSLSVLALYWPLALLPVPHATTNLFVPGANFISWIDRTVLGAHALVTGPRGYDPEGLLSTAPAIAQCLLGASFGEWFLRNRARSDALLKLVAAGIGFLLLGLCWSLVFPVVKNIWTSSFVLVSSGISMLLFCALYWVLDERKIRLRGAAFFEAFGMNALFAYVLQELAQLLPATGNMHAIGSVSLKTDMPVLVGNLPVLAFILILWAPLELMRRRRWIVKL